ncbi:R3H domain-containing nucleic acid-binding protein [Terrabacter sp. NPDC080008]|uniref:Jag family protein n=1 Tax=Terrabacter sp. NPDC080008 TaxID=3155176 RepID=UPI00344C3A36
MSDTQSPDVETNDAVTTPAETDAARTHNVQPDDVESSDVEAPVVATTEGALVPEIAEAADEAASSEGAGGTGEAGKANKGSRLRQLEREGEVAADFLETLLDIADLDGDIDVDVDGDRAAIAIVDSEEGRVPRRLVGTDGKVLEALQELTRLAVQVQTGERSRLMLDIAGHRAQRRSALVELAHAAIAEVKESGQKRSLDPMSAFERKVVHDEVSAAGLVSESEGVEPNRHIVILPA